jgi:hypothetical protein
MISLTATTCAFAALVLASVASGGTNRLIKLEVRNA